MGLAPYGEPRYADQILDELVDLNDDGSFRLDLSYFGYVGGLTMTSDALRRRCSAARRASRSRRSPSARWTSPRSIQVVTEEVVLPHRPARRTSSPASATPVPGRRRRAQLRRERPAPARGPVRATSGSSPPPATPAARSARRCTAGTRSSASPARSAARDDACAARSSGRPSPTTRSRAASLAHGCPSERPRAIPTSAAARSRELVADGKVVGCSRAGWSSARGRWGTGRSSATRARRRCSRR